MKNTNQSAQEVEKLALEKYPTHNWMDNKMFNEELKKQRAFIDGYNQALQSKAGGFSKDELYSLMMWTLNMAIRCKDSGKKVEDMVDNVREKIQSLTHTSSKSGEYSKEDMRKAYRTGFLSDDIKLCDDFIQSLTPTPLQTKGMEVDEQKVLDALRFTWRNLNRLKEETEKPISRRMRNSMNLRIRKVMKFVDGALDEFCITTTNPSNKGA